MSRLSALFAPFTGEGEGLLFEGERIWIKEDPTGENALGAHAIPVEYEKLEERMVPKKERENSKFDGFYFYFKTVDLNRDFTLIQTEFNGKCGLL